MATSGETHEEEMHTDASVNIGRVLVWLDDSIEDDPTVKSVLDSFYDNVLIFTDPEECLELIESMNKKDSWISILISGKYGQMLVPERLQPLNQVKDIYVFCFDTAKHNRWGQMCDKVRCVFSDINKILQCMQYDVQNYMDQTSAGDEEEQPPLLADPEQIQIHVQTKQQRRERYIDDSNLFDQLAFNLLMQSPDDGVEDFTDYCRKYREEHQPEQEAAKEGDEPPGVEQYFKPEQPIQEWYQSDLFFAQIKSNDLTQLWTLRWFIRTFYRQLTSEYRKFIDNKPKFTVYCGAWLSTDELDGMKHRIGQIIIITELLLTCLNRQIVFDSLEEKKKNKNKIIFEIHIDPTIAETIPYAEIKAEEILLWCGSRYRVSKIEYIEDEGNAENSYWLIGLNLRSTFESKSSRQTLYEYYQKEFVDLNNLHHTFGRILMYKGLYTQAEEWLQIDPQYLELAEIAIRRSNYEKAKEYLQHLPDDSDQANLLRAHLNILISGDQISKTRLMLIRIVSESTDRLIRARANMTLGFLNLITLQQIDQALEYFTLANEVLGKLLPDIHPLFGKSFLGIGYAFYMQGKVSEAKESFEMAFRIQKQALVYNHPDFAKTRNARAHCLSTDQRTIKQALKESEYALNILLETFANQHHQHPEILATMNDLEKLKKGKKLPPRNTLLDYI